METTTLPRNLTTQQFFDELYGGDYTPEECEEYIEKWFKKFLDFWYISRQSEEHRRDCWRHEKKNRKKNPDYYYKHLYHGTELEKKWWSDESDQQDFVKQFKEYLNHEYDEYEKFMVDLYQEHLEKCNH